MFALHLVFTPRINTALDEFVTMFNNHRLSTEHGWTPNQLWMNGIVDERNPLNSTIHSSVDQFYGEDPDGPHPQSDTDEAVVVAPVQISHSREIPDYVIQWVNVNRPSCLAGMDIYCTVLGIVVQKLEEYT